jgi:RNA polymerase sigma-70 factor (ECF subfamily)
VPISATIIAQRAKLVAIALRIVKNKADAEDIAQEVLIKAHLDPRNDQPMGWAAVIAKRLAINLVRDAKRRGELLLENAPLTAEKTAEETRLDQGRLASKLLSLLDEETRSMIEMLHVEEASYKEISRALGIPEGTVISRTSRARNRLRTSEAAIDLPF